MQHSNIILIGMPGCGKSTIGVLLAKQLGYGFIDTDLLIQQSTRNTLREIIDRQGYLALREIEEKVLLGLAPVQQIVATGGSAVYSKTGLQHLKQLGTLVYLKQDLPSLELRVGNISERGIASDSRQSFEEIYLERCPLYEQAADITVDCVGLVSEEVVAAIITAVT